MCFIALDRWWYYLSFFKGCNCWGIKAVLCSDASGYKGCIPYADSRQIYRNKQEKFYNDLHQYMQVSYQKLISSNIMTMLNL